MAYRIAINTTTNEIVGTLSDKDTYILNQNEIIKECTKEAYDIFRFGHYSVVSLNLLVEPISVNQIIQNCILNQILETNFALDESHLLQTCVRGLIKLILKMETLDMWKAAYNLDYVDDEMLQRALDMNFLLSNEVNDIKKYKNQKIKGR